jgi:hypothetical protein
MTPLSKEQRSIPYKCLTDILLSSGCEPEKMGNKFRIRYRPYLNQRRRLFTKERFDVWSI